MNRQLLGFVVVLMLGLFCWESTAEAAPVRISIGRGRVARRVIRQTPILLRPNRPLHIYGNTVRKLHSKGWIRLAR